VEAQALQRHDDDRTLTCAAWRQELPIRTGNGAGFDEGDADDQKGNVQRPAVPCLPDAAYKLLATRSPYSKRSPARLIFGSLKVDEPNEWRHLA
jgi:hypothetical protein